MRSSSRPSTFRTGVITVKDRLPAGQPECPPKFAPERFMAAIFIEGREICRTGPSRQAAIDALRDAYPELRKVRIASA